jgi:hypothetical protein
MLFISPLAPSTTKNSIFEVSTKQPAAAYVERLCVVGELAVTTTAFLVFCFRAFYVLSIFVSKFICKLFIVFNYFGNVRLFKHSSSRLVP